MAQRCGYDSRGRYVCTRSSFTSWGRWIVLGVILLFAILFFLGACIVARRRRAKGSKPLFGTGWMPTGGKNNATAQQGYSEQQYAPPPTYGNPQPQYMNKTAAQPQYPTTTAPQSSYYPEAPKPAYAGGQSGGYEMNGSFQPPAGPPPGR